MSRIEKKFIELKQRGEAALIPFITAGDPDLATTLKIMRALEAGGADAIELGIPFSDPSADGPTIQRSSERALKNPITLPAIFRLVREFRPQFRIADHFIRLLQSIFSLRSRQVCQSSGASRRRRRALRRLAAGRERRAQSLHRSLRSGCHISPVADQRRGSAPLGRKSRPRLYLLCLGDRGHRRAAIFR